MKITTELQQYLKKTKLSILMKHGVEDWEGYQCAIDEMPDVDILTALENGGVEMWHNYNYAMGKFFLYEEYLKLLPQGMHYDNYENFDPKISAYRTFATNDTIVAIPPGETIKGLLYANKILFDDYAKYVELSSDSAEDLLEGRLELTNDVAKKLETLVCVPADFLIKLENRYREKLKIIKGC